MLHKKLFGIPAWIANRSNCERYSMYFPFILSVQMLVQSAKRKG